MTPKQEIALEEIAKAAVQSERSTGVPAEVTAAQCILESNWLTVAPQNNCFGVKHTSGPDNYCLTSEYVNGLWQRKQLDFQAYPSLADCFNAHATLLKCGPYTPAWERFQDDRNLDAFIVGISLHYATDPGYSAKIRMLANGLSVVAAVRSARRAVLT